MKYQVMEVGFDFESKEKRLYPYGDGLFVSKETALMATWKKLLKNGKSIDISHWEAHPVKASFSWNVSYYKTKEDAMENNYCTLFFKDNDEEAFRWLHYLEKKYYAAWIEED